MYLPPLPFNIVLEVLGSANKTRNRNKWYTDREERNNLIHR